MVLVFLCFSGVCLASSHSDEASVDLAGAFIFRHFTRVAALKHETQSRSAMPTNSDIAKLLCTRIYRPFLIFRFDPRYGRKMRLGWTTILG